MRLTPLYRLRFDYPESWAVELTGERGTEEQHLLFAEGTVQGGISGRFRGANYARRRTDQTFVTDFRGSITTPDGAVVLVEYYGYGRAYREPYRSQSPHRRQWVATAKHLAQDGPYARLNDAVCVGVGEVRTKPAGHDPNNPSELLLDVAELIWEPPEG